MRANPSIDWILFTDCEPLARIPPNVTVRRMSFDEYRGTIERRLRIGFSRPTPHKLCDVRPALGVVYREDIEEYDYFGWCDLDVIFGDLRRFLDDRVLTMDVVSTHADRVSGHFCLLRNTSRMRGAFRLCRAWRELFEAGEYQGFDELAFARALRWPRRPWTARSLVELQHCWPRRLYFVEQYSTVDSKSRAWHDGKADYPGEWRWERGHLTNDRDGPREFMYLHFMLWHSNRWRDDEGAPWPKLDRIVRLPDEGVGATRFTVSREGIRRLPSSRRA